MSMDTVVSLAQIAFWVIISIVAVLTYLQAKKSIFQPIRTEVFKMQTAEFHKLLAIFQVDSEVQLRELCAFREMLVLNAYAMFDDYAESALSVKIDRKNRFKKLGEDQRSSTTLKWLEQNVEQADGTQHVEPTGGEPGNLQPHQEWDDYEFGCIFWTKEYGKHFDEVNQFISNPTLPSNLTKELKKYSRILSENTSQIGTVLTEQAKKMPSHYPTKEQLRQPSADWILSEYHDRVAPLKPQADKIVGLIRSYFDPDRVVKSP